MHKLLAKTNIGYRVANQAHACCECGHEIPAGEKFVHIHGICDGFKLNFIHCPDCHTVFKNIYAIIDDHELGPAITELPAWINKLVAEHIDEADFIAAIASHLDVTPDKILNLYQQEENSKKIA